MSERRGPWRSLSATLALCLVAGPALAQQGDPPPPSGTGLIGGTSTGGTSTGGTSTGGTSTGGTSESSPVTPETAQSLEQELADAKDIPEFERIRTPPSPAFTMLGISPSQIQRPGMPRDFIIALASNLQASSDLTVPKDVAIEVAPYWWFSHKKMTFEDYHKAGWGQNLLRNLSFSVATSSRDIPILDVMGVQTGTLTQSHLAAGIRTQLYTGKSRADICDGRIPAKAAILAKAILSKIDAEELAALDKLVVASATIDGLERVTPLLLQRAAAQDDIDAANAALSADGATDEQKQAARLALQKAAAARKAVEDSYRQLEARMRKRAQRAHEALEAAKAKLASEQPAKSEETQKASPRAGRTAGRTTGKTATGKTSASKSAAQKRVDRAKARKLAADGQLAALVNGFKGDLAAVRDLRERASEDEKSARKARESASEKRKSKEVTGAYKKRLEELVALCKDASAARVGWNLSGALAAAWLFPESRFADGDLQTMAGWLTLAHSWKQGSSVAGLTRVAWSRKDEGERALAIDAGARVIQAHKKYAVSLEAVARTYTDDFVGVRAAVVAEYMVRKGSWLSVSFGKDFSNDDAIFTLANLNWGMGGEARLQ